jgi:RNA recognition motif-containing protein
MLIHLKNGTEEAPAADAGAEQNGKTDVLGQPLADTTNNESAAAQAGQADGAKPARQPRQPREPREQRQRGPPSDGVPSKTKVMVANLPYDIDEEKLMEIFKEYAPVSAKVALRPIPRFMVRKLQARNEPRKGRGFAFVTLATEELQQKAIQEVTGVKIADRDIVVKVAIDSPDKQDDENAEKENGTPATNGGADAEVTATAS